MREKLACAGLALLAAITMGSSSALAFSSGITTGSFGPNGCNQCHGGGSVPTVELSGPSAVAQGVTATYTLTVSNPGSQLRAGLNASANDGTFAVGGASSAMTQLFGGQITHTGPKLNSGGVTTFTFNWTAPNAPFAPVTMRAWGNAVNFNGFNTGDLAALDTLEISDGGAPPATATPTQTATQTPTQTPTATVTPVPPLCPATPQIGCATPAKSSLMITNKDDDKRDAVAFKWMKGPTTDIAEFGTPTTTTSYALCIYQDGLLHLEIDAPTGDICGKKPCWAAKPKGFAYKDKLATPNGLTMLSLARADVPGKAKIQMKAKGALLAEPISVPLNVPVAAQVVNNSNAFCWGDSWTTAEITNDGVKLKAKSSD